MTQPETSNSVERAIELVRKGTRQRHKASGDIYTLARHRGRDLLELERDRDGYLTRVAADDWLDDAKWGVVK